MLRKNNKIKFKDSISTNLLILTMFLLFVNVFINIFVSTFSVNLYYMTDLRTYMQQQKDNIIENYDDVSSLDSEYSIYDMRLEQYDTLNNKIIYSSRRNRTNTPISDNLTTDDMNSIFEDLIGKGDFHIFTIEDEKYKIIDNLLKNEEDQIIMLSKYSDNNYFVLQIPSPNIVYATSLSKRYAVFTMAASFIIMFPVVSIFSSFFVRPIKRLYETTEKIKDKNFDVKCKVDSKNEIGMLARSINEMSDSLYSYTKEIEDKNIQLEKDIEIKKKFEESQKKFVSDVSHEIKTPISIISAYTEGIKMGLVNTPEEINEYCTIILDECNRMSSITKQLLHLSKLENSTKKLDISLFDIITLVNEDMAKFDLKCKQNNIRLKLFNEENEILVYADRNEIETVIINYLQNAFKYCADPGIINVYINNEDEFVYIGVYNNGSNIKEDEKEKIWNRFYKEDKARTRKEDSTGLGLSIVKATMNLHNMPYGVINKEDGVEFFIRLKKHINNI